MEVARCKRERRERGGGGGGVGNHGKVLISGCLSTRLVGTITTSEDMKPEVVS